MRRKCVEVRTEDLVWRLENSTTETLIPRYSKYATTLTNLKNTSYAQYLLFQKLKSSTHKS
jgi:hypothetical protein